MIGLGWVHHASYLVTVFVEKKAKKGEPKSAVSQTLEFLGARNWTKVARRWRVRTGASFREKGLFRNGPY